jgi:hypothetical protein
MLIVSSGFPAWTRRNVFSQKPLRLLDRIENQILVGIGLEPGKPAGRQAGIDKRNGPGPGGQPPVPGGGRINLVNPEVAQTATRSASAVAVV